VVERKEYRPPKRGIRIGGGGELKELSHGDSEDSETKIQTVGRSLAEGSTLGHPKRKVSIGPNSQEAERRHHKKLARIIITNAGKTGKQLDRRGSGLKEVMSSDRGTK